MEDVYIMRMSLFLFALMLISVVLLFVIAVRYKMNPVWWLSLLCPPLSLVAFYSSRYIDLESGGAGEKTLSNARKCIRLSVMYVVFLWLALVGTIILWAFRSPEHPTFSPMAYSFWTLLFFTAVFLMLIKRYGGFTK